MNAARATSDPGKLPCATCGSDVDPLRADRVALFGERFRYFCSVACHERYEPRVLLTPLPAPRERPSQELRPVAIEATVHVEPAELREIRRITHSEEGELEPASATSAELEPIQAREEREALPASGEGTASAIGALLLALSSIGGGLAVALSLAGNSSVAVTARLVLTAVSACALAAETFLGVREETEQSPLARLAAPVGAVLLAIFAYVSASESTSGIVTLAGLLVASSALSVLLVRRVRRPVDLERTALGAELDGTCKRVVLDEELAETRAVDLRPGEEIVLDSGDVVPVDATLTAGSAVVLPWRGASVRAERHEGDVLVAGARVVEGRLRAIVSWAGPDRAWLRLSTDPRRRADLHAGTARVGRLIVERIAPFITGAAALAAFAANLDPLEIGVLCVSIHAALTCPILAAAGSQYVARAILEGLRRGIAFRTADAFDRAGKVSMLAFCARGTLQLGEPEVADIDAFFGHRPSDVLSLVAGAESGSQHAVSTAILRAARARGVRPDGTRSPTPQAGLGVTAVASNGQALVVGSRALMLKEHVSIAAVESRITALEAMGRSVLLVALGDRLIGLLGLQDGLRPGARASVQHALDIGVEPVLLSGDARETCEALGRALDIDHIRPEIPPAERGDAIRRLADGGAIVAVVGRSQADEVALSAADVSIALGAAGSTSSEWNVQLASDDVRDAAFAIRLAHEARREARLSLALILGPAVAFAIVAGLGLAAPAWSPIGALLGGGVALVRLRARR